MQAKTVFTQRLNWMSVGTSCGNPLRMTIGAVRVHVMVTLANNLIGECNMTDNDIRDFIESCEEPIFLRDVVSELTSKDPTVSWKRVARLMREMGYENKPCKNARNPKGKGSVWTRGNDFATDDDEVDEEEQDEPKERTTEDVVSDVEARNAANIEMNRRLLETLQISRNLKQEMMEKQVDALVSMARMILAIHGSDDEKRRYFLQ
jgi:hypothetical protein